jgi:hypothetical protein
MFKQERETRVTARAKKEPNELLRKTTSIVDNKKVTWISEAKKKGSGGAADVLWRRVKLLKPA